MELGRRHFIGYVGAGIVVPALLLEGCGSNLVGTGVRGLDTPDQILSNPYVNAVINEAVDAGLPISPERGVNPPVISGRYSMTGWREFPGSGALAPGEWVWSNQTTGNQIDTVYSQLNQGGSGTRGEIIRGDGRRFTVYSVLDIDDSFCGRERFVTLVDGVQDSVGNISAVYVGTPVGGTSCLAPSGGSLDLSLEGFAKVRGKEGGVTLFAVK